MLHKLFRRRDAASSLPAIPDGRRIYAIGDIHGCIDQLDRLLELIDADDRARGGDVETGLIFLGDLIDRGPGSAQVVERLRTLAAPRPGMRFLMGNHEEIFLGALSGDDKALRLFCKIGGRETLLSYGMTEQQYLEADYAELVRAMVALVPANHIAFLDAFENMIVAGDYAFVHAGVRPDVELAEQATSDLRWIREPFLAHDRRLEKIIVHGHTVSAAVEFRPHRIGIDTGAYRAGDLTALGLEGTERWVIAAPA